MKLFAALTLVSMLCLGAFAAGNGTPEQSIDLTKLEADVTERVDKWLENAEKIPEHIRTSDPSYAAQKAYYGSLKTDFITVLKTPPDALSDDAFVQAIHSSLRHYAGISKELTFYPPVMGVQSGPTVFTWYLESNNLQLRSSAVEQLCKWLIQNQSPEIKGWATVNSPEDASEIPVFMTRQTVLRFGDGAYAPYFTKAAVADFMQFIDSIATLDADHADALAARADINRVFREIIKQSPEALRAYFLKNPKVSPEAAQALFDNPLLADAFSLTADQSQ